MTYKHLKGDFKGTCLYVHHHFESGTYLLAWTGYLEAAPVVEFKL